MSAIWLVARAGLRGRVLDSLAVVVMAGLAGAVVVASLSGARLADTSFERLRERSKSPDIDVELSEPGDPAIAEEIAAIDGVTGVGMGAFVATTIADLGLVPFESTIAFAVVAEEGEGGFDGLVVAGRPLDNEAPDEIVVNSGMAEFADLEVGDEVELVSIARDDGMAALEEGVTELRGDAPKVRVVGVLAGAEDVADTPEPVVVTSRAFTEHYDVFAPAIVLGVRVDDGAAPQVYRELRDLLPDATVTPSGEFRDRIEDGIDVQVLGLIALAVSVGVAGLVATWQAVSRLMGASAADDATAGALGVAPGQRQLVGAVRLAPSALGAALVAGTVGWLAGPWAITGLFAQVEGDQSHWFDVPVVVGVAAVVALVVVIAAMVTGRRRTHDEDAWDRASAIERAVLRSGIPPIVALGMRRVVGRRAGRAGGAASVAALVAAVAAVVGVATFSHSRDVLLREPSLWGADFDLVGSNGFDLEATDRATDVLAEDDRVDSAAVEHEAEVTARQPNGEPKVFPLVAVQPVRGDIPFRVTSGSGVAADGDAIVGREVMEELEVDVGESLTVETDSGKHTLRVAGTAVIYSNDSIDDSIVVTMGTAEEMDAVGDGIVIVRFADGVSEAEGAALMDELFVEFEAVPAPGSVDNLDEIGGLPNALAGAVALLGLVATASTLAGSARHGRREVGVLRALGARGRQVAATVLAHGATLAVLACLIGVPLGIILGRQVLRVVVDGIGAVYHPSVPVADVAVVAGATVVSVLAIALIPAWLAARDRPGAALRAE